MKNDLNYFTLHTGKIKFDDFYIFDLNGESEQPDYFIEKGEELLVNKVHYDNVSLGKSNLKETVNHGCPYKTIKTNGRIKIKTICLLI